MFRPSAYYDSQGDLNRTARTVVRANRARRTRRMTHAGWLKYLKGTSLWLFSFPIRWPNAKKYGACMEVARQRLRSTFKRPLEKDRHVTLSANVLPEGLQDPGSW